MDINGASSLHTPYQTDIYYFCKTRSVYCWLTALLCQAHLQFVKPCLHPVQIELEQASFYEGCLPICLLCIHIIVLLCHPIEIFGLISLAVVAVANQEAIAMHISSICMYVTRP